jgi:hypothetical protein
LFHDTVGLHAVKKEYNTVEMMQNMIVFAILAGTKRYAIAAQIWSVICQYE